MKIKIIYIEGSKDTNIQHFEELYSKRIKPYSSIELIKIKPEKIKNENEISAVKTKETKKLFKHISNGYTVILDEQGQTFSSVKFSEFIEGCKDSSETLNFIIGAAFGLDRSLFTKDMHTISLSSMTFTHGLARILLLEQIYRAFTIIGNKTYHY